MTRARRMALAASASAAAALAVCFGAFAQAAPTGLGPGIPTGVPEFTNPAEPLSQDAIPESPGWKGYILDSPTPSVYPAKVSVLGDPAAVTDPEGLMERGGSVTTLRTGAAIVVDLGRNVGGTMGIEVTTASGGPLRVSYSEARRYLQPLGDTRGVGSLGLNDDPNGRSDIVAAPGFYESPGTRGGERYLLISLDTPGEYAIDFVRVAVRHLRPSVDDYTGHFLSSSKLLNRIWFAGAYTLNTNAVRDPRQIKSQFKLVDGAKRDRLLWLGDLAMQGLVGEYTVTQMPDIIKRSLHSFSCQQEAGGYIPMASDLNVSCNGRPGPADGPPTGTAESFPSLVQRDRLPAYTPWFIIAVCDRVQFTGDVEETQQLLPVMRRALKYFKSKQAPDGLFATPDGAINWRAFDVTVGEDAHTNAVWVRSMRRLALVEEQIGDPGKAKADRAQADQLQKALIKVLFDPKANLFLTNTLDPIRNHAQDGTVEALLSGVLRGKAADAAMRALRKRLWTKLGPLTGESEVDPYVSRYISPYMSGWELIARLAHRDGAGSKRLMTTLWGHMVNSSPHSTLWEAMDPSGTPVTFGNGRVYKGRTSLAHGWSAAPVVALSGYVAGMRPTAPGWAEWLVEPQTLNLRFAQGRVGTIHGSLAARWQIDSRQGSFKMTVEAPEGTSGIVSVPLLGARRAIARDGRIVWLKGNSVGGSGAITDGTYVSFPQSSGTHTYAWRGKG